MIIKETSDAYDARRRSEWISPSDIKGLDVPMDFIVNRSKPFEKKSYFDVGTALHTSVLEPKLFASEVTYFPEENFPDQKNKTIDGAAKLTPQNKTAMEEFQAERPKVTVLREADWGVVAEMTMSIEAHPGAKRLFTLNKGLAEHSFYCRYIFHRNGDLDRIEECPADAKRDSKLTLLVRTKADFVKEKSHPVAMDLKTARSVNPREFGRDAANMEYDIQGAMILDLVSANMGEYYESFIFVAVEKSPPYYVAMYDLDFTDIKDAQNKYIKRLNVIRKAKNDGKFAGYEYLADNEWGLLPLNLPAWYKKYQLESKF